MSSTLNKDPKPFKSLKTLFDEAVQEQGSGEIELGHQQELLDEYKICERHNITKKFADTYFFQKDEAIDITKSTNIRISNKLLSDILLAKEDLKIHTNKRISLTKTINALLRDAIKTNNV